MSITQKRLLLIFLSLLLLPACNSSSREIAESSQVVAKVNDKEITTSYVERRISKLSPMARKALKTKEGQQEFIKSLTGRELIIQAAKEEKLDKAAGFVTKVRDYKQDLLTQLYLQKKLQEKKLDLTDQEIKDYYASQQENFKEQPELRISHIFLASEVEANDILAQINQGADFAKLAAEKSANRATAARGGDMGYLRKWQLPPEIADKIFSMEVGQVTDVVASDFGYTIIKVTDKRMGQTVALEKIAGAIKSSLMRKKQREAVDNMIDELKKKAKITMNESVLASLNLSLSDNPEVGEKTSVDNAQH